MLRSDKGFTLVETMVALGIFAIALGSLPGVLISNIRANAFARHITAATSFAQDEMEVIRNTPFANVTSGSDTVTDAGTTATYTRTWTASNGPTATTRQVVVTVTWTDYTAHQVQLNTMITG